MMKTIRRRGVKRVKYKTTPKKQDMLQEGKKKLEIEREELYKMVAKELREGKPIGKLSTPKNIRRRS